MKPIDKCVSLETAKALADAGIVIESERYIRFEWATMPKTVSQKRMLLESDQLKNHNPAEISFIPRPDSDELLGWLPTSIGEKTWFQYTKSLNGYGETVESVAYVRWGTFRSGEPAFIEAIYKITIYPHSENKSLAEALAQLALHLRGEGAL